MTKEEVERLDKLSRSGCVVSRVFNNVYAPADIHHLTRGGRRLGHRFTIPLTPWYHRGVPDPGLTPEQMRAVYGPSLAEGKRAFENYFDTEERLLEEADKWLGILEHPMFYESIGSVRSPDSRKSTAGVSTNSTRTGSPQKGARSKRTSLSSSKIFRPPVETK